MNAQLRPRSVRINSRSSTHDCDGAQHYWSDRPANETVLEYARFEYGPDAANLVVDAIALLERTYPAPLQCGEFELDTLSRQLRVLAPPFVVSI